MSSNTQFMLGVGLITMGACLAIVSAFLYFAKDTRNATYFVLASIALTLIGGFSKVSALLTKLLER